MSFFRNPKLGPPVAPTGVYISGPHGDDPVQLIYEGVEEGLHAYVLEVNDTYFAMLTSGKAALRIDIMPPKTKVSIRPFPRIEGQL